VQAVDWDKLVEEALKFPNLREVFIRAPRWDQDDHHVVIQTFAPTIIFPLVKKHYLPVIFRGCQVNMTISLPCSAV
jgi:hypothetical protein